MDLNLKVEESSVTDIVEPWSIVSCNSSKNQKPEHPPAVEENEDRPLFDQGGPHPPEGRTVVVFGSQEVIPARAYQAVLEYFDGEAARNVVCPGAGPAATSRLP